MIKDFAKTYRLAIIIGVLFSVNALSISLVGTLSGVDHWDGLTTTQQFCIVGSIVTSWTNVMLAFLNKTVSRIESGKSPIDTGDTTVITKGDKI